VSYSNCAKCQRGKKKGGLWRGKKGKKRVCHSVGREKGKKQRGRPYLQNQGGRERGGRPAFEVMRMVGENPTSLPSPGQKGDEREIDCRRVKKRGKGMPQSDKVGV